MVRDHARPFPVQRRLPTVVRQKYAARLSTQIRRISHGFASPRGTLPTLDCPTAPFRFWVPTLTSSVRIIEEEDSELGDADRSEIGATMFGISSTERVPSAGHLLEPIALECEKRIADLSASQFSRCL